MQTDEQYLLLLTKQCEGALMPDEDVMLQRWLDQSTEHQRLADQVRQIWDKSGQWQGQHFQPDVEADFGRVLARIRTEESTPQHALTASKVRIGGWWLRAAAAIALVLAAVGIWRSTQSAPVADVSVVASAEVQKIDLPDGSAVWLRQHSTLRYPAVFSTAERRIQLKGEGYFEVAHNPAQPFVVELPNADQVRVLGTSFGVSQEGGNAQTHVQVRSGKVLFSPKEQPKGVTLTAHQSAAYDRASGRILVRKDSLLNHLAWQTGSLEFVRTPLRQVITDLEHHYRVRIVLGDQSLQECLYNSPRTHQPIQQVLASVARTYQMQVVESAQGSFELRGGKCR